MKPDTPMANGNSAANLAFKWEWNINTVAVLIGFVGMFIAWGYTLAEIESGRVQNADNIERLARENSLFAGRIDLMERTLNKLDQTEYRMAQMEKAYEAIDTRVSRISESYSNQFADFRTQLSAISTQIALTNQTLNRIEAQPRPGPVN